MSKKRGLNRGLESLLADTGLLDLKTNSKGNPKDLDPSNNLINVELDLENKTGKLNVSYIKINQLTPGKFQPRRSIKQEDLNELVASISQQGVLQPLIVRKLDKHYEIIAGERRWQAANIVGLTEIPVIIKNVNDQDALTIAIIENIQRSDLNPIDQALALDKLAKEFKLTHNEIALTIGKSRATITNLMRILQLPPEIKTMLEQQKLDLGHAKVLLSAPENLRSQIAQEIICNNLSVRATEQLLKTYTVGKNIQPTVPNNIEELNNHLNSLTRLQKTIDPDLHRLQQQLTDILGNKVMIKTKNIGKKNKGKIIIMYNSLEELEGILDQFNCKNTNSWS